MKIWKGRMGQNMDCDRCTIAVQDGGQAGSVCAAQDIKEKRMGRYSRVYTIARNAWYLNLISFQKNVCKIIIYIYM